MTFVYVIPSPWGTPFVPPNFYTMSLSWVSFFVLLKIPFSGNYTFSITKFLLSTFSGIRSYYAESFIPRMKDALIWPSKNLKKWNFSRFSFCKSFYVLLISHTKNTEGSLIFPILNNLFDLSLIACISSWGLMTPLKFLLLHNFL